MKTLAHEHKNKLQELTEDLRNRDGDEFDKMMHQTAATNIENACEMVEFLVLHMSRSIYVAHRCPNPELRKLQLTTWVKCLDETAIALNKIAALTRKDLL